MQENTLVALDIGSREHEVVIGNQNGLLIDHFKMTHDPAGMDCFFDRVQQASAGGPVSVAMEGYNGWARPLDRAVQSRGWQLYNVNNLKLARYKEIFPAPAKTDAIDAKRILELFAFQGQKHIARDVLQAVPLIPQTHRQLKYLSRRRRLMVNDKMQRETRLQCELQAYAPGIMSMTNSVSQLWYLRFLTAKPDLRMLATFRPSSIKKIKGVGDKFAQRIQQWQPLARFAPDIEMATQDLVNDAKCILTLKDDIKQIDRKIEQLLSDSESAQHLQSMPGFGPTSTAEIIGELGCLSRFTREASFAYYMGMAPLDKSSGVVTKSVRSKNINKACQNAMMTCVVRHIRCVEQSRQYYERKRQQGKRHNHAVRALGRHLCKVIWKMLTEGRDYQLKNIEKT